MTMILSRPTTTATTDTERFCCAFRNKSKSNDIDYSTGKSIPLDFAPCDLPVPSSPSSLSASSDTPATYSCHTYLPGTGGRQEAITEKNSNEDLGSVCTGSVSGTKQGPHGSFGVTPTTTGEAKNFDNVVTRATEFSSNRKEQPQTANDQHLKAKLMNAVLVKNAEIADTSSRVSLVQAVMFPVCKSEAPCFSLKETEPAVKASSAPTVKFMTSPSPRSISSEASTPSPLKSSLRTGSKFVGGAGSGSSAVKTHRRVRGLWNDEKYSRSPFIALQDNTLQHIFSNLSMLDLLSVSGVCRRWRHISGLEPTWKRVDATDFVHEAYRHFSRTRSTPRAAAEATSYALSKQLERFSPESLTVREIGKRLVPDIYLPNGSGLRELFLTGFEDLTDTHVHVMLLSSSVIGVKTRKKRTNVIRKLVLEDCPLLTSSCVRSVALHCPNLEELSLRGNRNINDITALKNLWRVEERSVSEPSSSERSNSGQSLACRLSVPLMVPPRTGSVQKTRLSSSGLTSMFAPPASDKILSSAASDAITRSATSSYSGAVCPLTSMFNPPVTPVLRQSISSSSFPVVSGERASERNPMHPNPGLCAKPASARRIAPGISPLSSVPRTSGAASHPPVPVSSGGLGSLFRPPSTRKAPGSVTDGSAVASSRSGGDPSMETPSSLFQGPSTKPPSAPGGLASLFAPPPSRQAPTRTPTPPPAARQLPPAASSRSSGLVSLFDPPGSSPVGNRHRRTASVTSQLSQSASCGGGGGGKLRRVDVSLTKITPSNLVDSLRQAVDKASEVVVLHSVVMKGTDGDWNEQGLKCISDLVRLSEIQCFDTGNGVNALGILQEIAQDPRVS